MKWIFWAGGLILVMAGVAAIGNDIFVSRSPATVEEIQASIAGSGCAKQLLIDANRNGQTISRNDLVRVKDLCVDIDRQALAFTASK